jgi:hypothetical protein
MITEPRPDKKVKSAPNHHGQLNTHPYAWRIRELEKEEETEGNKMRVLLRKVAIKKKFNTADQLQWMNAVETKLKLIDWDCVSRVRRYEVLIVNSKLINIGQSQFHNTTLQFMLTLAADDLEECWVTCTIRRRKDSATTSRT